MKVVKLNNRHKAYKLGYTYALRFDSWGDQARQAEYLVASIYGRVAFNKRGPYYALFGRKPKGAFFQTYWINLRNESDISLILLRVTKNEQNSIP